jgi:cytochrome P450
MSAMNLTAPQAVPGRPLLGSLLDFQRDRVGFSLRVAREHGDLAEARLGFVRLLLVSSPVVAREVLVEKADAFHKSFGLSIFARPLLGNGLLTSENGVHKRQRRLMAPLFAHKRIAGYADVMRERAVAGADRLLAAARSQTGTIDVADHMMRITLEIVGQTLFDAELGTSADDVGGALTRAMQEMMNGMVRLVPTPPVVPTPGNLRLWQAVRQLDAVVGRLIRERRRSGVDRGDLLGLLLAARHEDDGSALSDTEIRDQAMTIMLAGHETTANALSWTLYLLSRNPEARERVEREIDEVLGHRPVTTADLPALPLALQAIKEAMRLYPPAYIIGRTAVRPVTIAGAPLPKGRVLLVNVSGIHRRPDAFPDPDRFDLDRLTADAEKALPPLAYMPFGAGARICIGNHFALLEGHVVLVTLLQRLRIEVTRTHVDTEALVTLRPKDGLPARVVERR